MSPSGGFLDDPDDVEEFEDDADEDLEEDDDEEYDEEETFEEDDEDDDDDYDDGDDEDDDDYDEDEDAAYNTAAEPSVTTPPQTLYTQVTPITPATVNTGELPAPVAAPVAEPVTSATVNTSETPAPVVAPAAESAPTPEPEYTSDQKLFALNVAAVLRQCSIPTPRDPVLADSYRAGWLAALNKLDQLIADQTSPPGPLFDVAAPQQQTFLNDVGVLVQRFEAVQRDIRSLLQPTA